LLCMEPTPTLRPGYAESDAVAYGGFLLSHKGNRTGSSERRVIVEAITNNASADGCELIEHSYTEQRKLFGGR